MKWNTEAQRHRVFLIDNYFRHGVTKIVNKMLCLRVSVFVPSGLNPYLYLAVPSSQYNCAAGTITNRTR